MRKLKWIWFVLGLMATLCACSMETVDRMYQLPKRSESFYDLQASIDKAMEGLEYSAPLAGERRQSVQMADLDGDGQQEYLVYTKGDANAPLQILIFDRQDSHYIHTDTIESSGSSFEQVEYVQMDAKPGLEMVVGRRVSDQVLRSLSVYTFSGGQAEQLFTANYYKFLPVSLDEDSYSELFVIRPGTTEADRGIVELYGVENGSVNRSVELEMSESADKLKRILAGKLHGGEPAVYIASTTNDDAALITDVYAVVDGVLTNVTVSNESGTSVKTLRNYYVYADDIDSDGVIELPHLIGMRPVPEARLADDQYMIRWYAMTGEGGEVDKVYTYHNFVGGWYLELDSSLAYRMTAVQDGTAYSFYVWDDTGKTAQQVMTVFTFTGQDRQQQGAAADRCIIYQTDSAVYSLSLTGKAAQYGIDSQSVANAFHLIHQEWKTGET
ncbi:MAG: hypothetical protein E7437_02335 [Ruminococcaceae bacterium]|nr:hypothetical protein [Oscillospiraceae bacterium]